MPHYVGFWRDEKNEGNVTSSEGGATFRMRCFLANCIHGLTIQKFRRTKGRMRGSVIGNENIEVEGYPITQSFETDHKILDTVLGKHSNSWAGMRVVSEQKWK